ncbi:hypothetical protein PHISCL_05223 [Aspergillus sclerotialis]|uniref:Uncharacterized protein n=1 Tax=Aspergillus sclerotialis TaxID=2070753 RepID=A0A3A2ZHE1_9EURO|nr:hypothetical protein PHISCL_05223 [Aspergillus sclerotialis]
MQYIPFPTCKETSLPLSLRYGVSESINCTIASLPDEMYHLLEYYVHSDVPMTCRVPTEPLSSIPAAWDKRKEEDSVNVLESSGPSYTPLTFGLQGTLQTSHLHLWTDMNVLAHKISSSAKGSKKARSKGPGYVVAGTAYSVPEFHSMKLKKGAKLSKEEESVAVAEAAREPWTAGHGTKVIRGEPLTFTFHVRWIEGGNTIGWPARGDEGDSSSGIAVFFSKVVFFVLAASVGAMVALYWERKRRVGWRGDGILGAPPRGKGSVGITYGNGGRINGYGGYSSASGAAVSGNGVGYGLGKRD